MAVRCRDASGASVRVTWTEHGEFVTPGSALDQRIVTVDGVRLVRKFVSREAGRSNPKLYDLLDNEIRAGARLGRVFAHRYPSELPRLAYYDMDSEEPFVLLGEYLGEPARDPARRFDDGQRRIFVVGLLRALQLTAAAQVVHGAVAMGTVRWNVNQLQLVDFEHAGRTDEAGVGDDVWAAGVLIRELYLGPRASMSSRAGDPERLRALLDPVFDSTARQRPHPADLLGMLRADSTLPAMVDPDDDLAAGRQHFDQVCRAKRGQIADAKADPAERQPAGWARKLLPFLSTAAVVALLIIGLVVLR